MLHVLALKPSDDPTAYVAMLLGGLVVIYLAVLRPMMRKRKDPLERPTARTGLAQQRAVERDMQHLLVEYEKMIRNMTAGLDTRAAKLETLIREADEKLAALRAANAAAVQGTNGSSPAPPAAFGPLFSPASAEGGTSATSDPRVAEIYALADQGLSVRDVARRVGIPHGEIELMLNVRARPEKRPAAAT